MLLRTVQKTIAGRARDDRCMLHGVRPRNDVETRCDAARKGSRRRRTRRNSRRDAETQRKKEHFSMFPLRFSSHSLLLCAFASLRDISFSCVVCATEHHLMDIMRRPHPLHVHRGRPSTPGPGVRREATPGAAPSCSRAPPPATSPAMNAAPRNRLADATSPYLERHAGNPVGGPGARRR
jgi:hypothetical protein